MKQNKKLVYIVSAILLLSFSLSSCLTAGLEELPAFEDANITNFKFEYRWSVKEGGIDKLQVKEMSVKRNINNETQTVSIQITVPAAGNDFPEAERAKVSLKNIVGFCSISTAAKLEPIGDAPKLGVPADFSKDNMRYKVTAADGKTVKEWKLVIESFST